MLKQHRSWSNFGRSSRRSDALRRKPRPIGSAATASKTACEFSRNLLCKALRVCNRGFRIGQVGVTCKKPSFAKNADALKIWSVCRKRLVSYLCRCCICETRSKFDHGLSRGFCRGLRNNERLSLRVFRHESAFE